MLQQLAGDDQVRRCRTQRELRSVCSQRMYPVGEALVEQPAKGSLIDRVVGALKQCHFPVEHDDEVRLAGDQGSEPPFPAADVNDAAPRPEMAQNVAGLNHIRGPVVSPEKLGISMNHGEEKGHWLRTSPIYW